MSSRSSSPSILSDNDSELSSSLSEDVPEIIEGEFIPYDENLEPVATQEEAAAFEENSVREEEEQAVTKAEECICCKEIDRVGEVMSQVDLEDQCITLHPGFRDVCLNRWVLEIASLALKTKAGKSDTTLFSQGLKSESEFLRSVSYRQFTRLLWDFVGSSKRYPLPCCAYNAIRKAFPSENGQYHGFEEEED
ncbi:hypothetical protein P5673_005068 [Acropora cervicornis]|uniref:P2X purinoreceptor 7 intracellular domain-containing protein n=1 Tax=Acropora cervicornis TaxID=6130 RepID=A0AAD9QZE9_ACRCE|nr:hypothetical protein P5673_005068 [Acropora cervicornis]